LYRNKVLKKINTAANHSFPVIKRSANARFTIECTDVEQDLRRIKEEAFEQGFRAGKVEGYSAGEKKVLALVAELERVLAELDQWRRRLEEELEPQVLELALTIARRILREELKLAPEHVVAMTRSAVEKLRRRSDVVIRVSPELAEMFSERRNELLEACDGLTIEVDPECGPHGVVVSGPEEEVVVELDEQIRNLVKEMADVVRNGNGTS